MVVTGHGTTTPDSVKQLPIPEIIQSLKTNACIVKLTVPSAGASCTVLVSTVATPSDLLSAAAKYTKANVQSNIYDDIASNNTYYNSGYVIVKETGVECLLTEDVPMSCYLSSSRYSELKRLQLQFNDVNELDEWLISLNGIATSTSGSAAIGLDDLNEDDSVYCAVQPGLINERSLSLSCLLPCFSYEIVDSRTFDFLNDDDEELLREDDQALSMSSSHSKPLVRSQTLGVMGSPPHRTLPGRPPKQPNSQELYSVTINSVNNVNINVLGGNKRTDKVVASVRVCVYHGGTLLCPPMWTSAVEEVMDETSNTLSFTWNCELVSSVSVADIPPAARLYFVVYATSSRKTKSLSMMVDRDCQIEYDDVPNVSQDDTQTRIITSPSWGSAPSSSVISNDVGVLPIGCINYAVVHFNQTLHTGAQTVKLWPGETVSVLGTCTLNSSDKSAPALQFALREYALKVYVPMPPHAVPMDMIASNLDEENILLKIVSKGNCT